MKQRKNMQAWWLIILFTFAICGSGQAQSEEKTTKSNKVDIIPLPILFSSPETSFGFGALASLSFTLGEDPETTRKSNVQPYILYTVQGQLDATARYTIFTNEEKYIINGALSYLFFPEFYYGIGNNLPETNEELVSYRRVRIVNRVLRKISKKLFAGLQYRYVEMFQVEPEEGGLLETSRVPGFDGSRISGIGAAVVLDSRDNILNSSKGAYLEVSNYNYFSGLGSEFDFNTVTVDLRKYFRLFPKREHILAIQGFGNFVSGTAPYKELSEFAMRGYYRGRYRENNYLNAQVEYRLPLFQNIPEGREKLPWYRRFGLTAFVGLGDVANEVNQFDSNNLKYSYGGGLRFKLDRKNNINIRLDYGFGSDGSSGFYLEIGEAF
ncbi:hypothetical protein BKI52_13635 [marine bacterium AO1-C]|nr:hypothetical protein BKI52_13635 [marine bacterium AO1-C]